MTSTHPARMDSRILSSLTLSLAALTLLIPLAAPAQRSAEHSSASVPAQTGRLVPASFHPMLPGVDDAGHIAASGSSLSFLSPLSFAAGGLGASSVAVGDVNGDGKPDL